MTMGFINIQTKVLANLQFRNMLTIAVTAIPSSFLWNHLATKKTVGIFSVFQNRKSGSFEKEVVSYLEQQKPA